MERKVEVKIARGKNGESFDKFEINLTEDKTILDLLTYIQRNIDNSLSYRFACRVGMCGSCAMRVNGKPKWTCRTLVSTVIENNQVILEPLSNLPVVKDLVVDMEPFFNKWQKAEGKFFPSDTESNEFAAITPDNKKRKRADEAIECINCGCCYSACDVVATKKGYLGPAALNRAWSLINDEKDGARIQRLIAISSDDGCHNCHTNSQCVARCPLQLNPTRSIAGLKKAVAISIIKGEI